MKAVRTSWTGPEHAPITREAPAITARPRRSRARSQDVYEELFELAPDACPFTAHDGRIPCSMIVHELVSNALQHAFPGGRGGRIAIDLVAETPGHVRLGVSDDGVGLPPGDEPVRGGSLGLQLVSMTVEQIAGTLEVRRTPGAGFQILFPQGGETR